MSDSLRPQRRQPTRLPHPWDSPGKNAGVGCHFLLQCMKGKVKVKSLNLVRLLATAWTAAHQVPPSMGFSRQECWSGVPLPSLSSTSRYSINPWMQPRQPRLDLRKPCSILAPFSGNDYLQKQGIEIQGKVYLLGISPYHFSFCTDSATHGHHIPKSSDLHSSVDFGPCRLWLHQLSMAMKTLFR